MPPLSGGQKKGAAMPARLRLSAACTPFMCCNAPLRPRHAPAGKGGGKRNAILFEKRITFSSLLIYTLCCVYPPPARLSKLPCAGRNACIGSKMLFLSGRGGGKRNPISCIAFTPPPRPNATQYPVLCLPPSPAALAILSTPSGNPKAMTRLKRQNQSLIWVIHHP